MRFFVNELEKNVVSLNSCIDTTDKDNAAIIELIEKKRLEESKGLQIDNKLFQREFRSKVDIYYGDFEKMYIIISDMRCLLDLIEDDIKAELKREKKDCNG